MQHFTHTHFKVDHFYTLFFAFEAEMHFTIEKFIQLTFNQKMI